MRLLLLGTILGAALAALAARRRAVVVLDLADWRALHGDAGLEP